MLPATGKYMRNLQFTVYEVPGYFRNVIVDDDPSRNEWFDVSGLAQNNTSKLVFKGLNPEIIKPYPKYDLIDFRNDFKVRDYINRMYDYRKLPNGEINYGKVAYYQQYPDIEFVKQIHILSKIPKRDDIFSIAINRVNDVMLNYQKDLNLTSVFDVQNNPLRFSIALNIVETLKRNGVPENIHLNCFNEEAKRRGTTPEGCCKLIVKDALILTSLIDHMETIRLQTISKINAIKALNLDDIDSSYDVDDVLSSSYNIAKVFFNAKLEQLKLI